MHRSPNRYVIIGVALLGVIAFLGAGDRSLLLAPEPVSPSTATSEAAGEEISHHCRFWGLVGTGYEPELIDAHLRSGGESLKKLARYMDDGWGFTYFPPSDSTTHLDLPLVRRGGPYASHPTDPEYDLAIDELVALNPKALLASIRVIPDGAYEGAPSPHPFLKERTAFTHSGYIWDENEFRTLFLGGDYLDEYPVDYDAPFIDSELLFLALERLVRNSEFTGIEAYLDAVLAIIRVTGDDRLDFALTAGDSLLVLRYAGDNTSDPVYYAPGNLAALSPRGESDYWVVSTEQFGLTTTWSEIPPGTLAVFKPGAAPRFHDLLELASGGLPGAENPIATTIPRKVQFYGLIGSGYPSAMLSDHLRDDEWGNLKQIGDETTDSWATVAFTDSIPALTLTRPVERRGGPPADHPTDPDYDLAVDEIMAIAPRAALGHVRLGTSGHRNLPDPHPFQHEGYTFAHNGTVSMSPVRDLLTADDPDYFDTWPPDYDPNPIDSEMYLLYLMKYKRLHPELSTAEALRGAVQVLGNISSGMLNFVMTAGDTLYALRFNDSVGVRFYPDGTAETPPSYWTAASQEVGEDRNWGTIPRRTLAVFVPNQFPEFYPIDGHLDPEFTLASAGFSALIDEDNDGWSAGFTFCCDPDVEWGIAAITFQLFKRELTEGGGGDEFPWDLLGSSTTRQITGMAVDELCLPVFQVAPDTLAEAAWEFKLELYNVDNPGEPVVVATGDDFSALSYLQLEGAARDTIPHTVPAFSVASLRLAEYIDQDNDGSASGFTIYLDPNYGTYLNQLEIFVEVMAFSGSSLRTIAGSNDFSLRGQAVDEMAVPVVISPDNQSPADWELALAFYNSDTDESLLIISHNEFPDLAAVSVEGFDFDGQLQLGAVAPNPVTGADPVAILITVPDDGILASYRIMDVTGRLIRGEVDLSLHAGRREISWDGRDEAGLLVGSGIYYCRISAGERTWRRRIVIYR